ncbi:hypothetical protein L5515_016263 [Caenorhabditis briggsae]|uniref:Uncharacterized protein n=1 Tax=Caenorhabditis briggsae TaxID=6238 RepID=A0AAE9FAY0_CAEBR|nr:hypothetical protein L5515_016263 [Caenorhabditis briggsae]
MSDTHANVATSVVQLVPPVSTPLVPAINLSSVEAATGATNVTACSNVLGKIVFESEAEHKAYEAMETARGRPKKENTTTSEPETATEASETTERRSSRTVKPTARRLQADEDDSFKKAHKDRATTETKNPVGIPPKQKILSQASTSQAIDDNGAKKTVQGKNPVGRPRRDRSQEVENYATWTNQQKERSKQKNPVGRPRKQSTQSLSTQNSNKLMSPYKQKTVPTKNPVGRPPGARQSVKSPGQNLNKEEVKPRGRPRKRIHAKTEQQDDVEVEYEFENEDTSVNVTDGKLVDKKNGELTHENDQNAEQRKAEDEDEKDEREQKEEKENKCRTGCEDKPDTRLLFTPEVFPDLAERGKNPESKSIYILPLPRPFSRDQTPFSEIYDELIDDIRKGRNCFPNAPHEPLFDFCLFCKSYRCTKNHYWYAYAINNRLIKSGKFDKDPITKESVLNLLCAFRDEHLLADSTERPVELDYRLEDYTIWHDI